MSCAERCGWVVLKKLSKEDLELSLCEVSKIMEIEPMGKGVK